MKEEVETPELSKEVIWDWFPISDEYGSTDKSLGIQAKFKSLKQDINVWST